MICPPAILLSMNLVTPLAMRRLFAAASIVVLLVLGFGNPASAHPHVFVTIKSEIVFDAEGRVTGIRHAWTFDDMFSSYATQGLEQKQKGVFTREELAPLAEVNVTSMKDFDFFTHGVIDGQAVAFADPVDYWLDYTDQVLTLHFTLPVRNPVKGRDLAFEIYDPVYFVAFDFGNDPVALVAAPSQCVFKVAKPQGDDTQTKSLAESFFDRLTSQDAFGAQFSNKIAVTCK